MSRLKIKKLLIIAVVFCLTFLFFSTTAVFARAESEAEHEKKLNETVLEQLDKLDLEDLEKYVQGLEGFGEGTLAERLFAYIDGGGVGYEYFFQEIASVFFGVVKKLLPSFMAIAAIGLLCGLLNSLQSKFLGQSTAHVIFFAAYMGALIPLLGVLSECIFSSKGCVEEIKTQMELVFPLMLTLMAASGGSVSVSIFRPAVAFLSSGLVGLISEIVFPITVVIIVFSMTGKLFGELKTEKFSAFFKSINKWIIGVGVSVFGLFFTVQGIAAATYDGVIRRTAKYAIGTGVPIVGGFLSGGFDLAVAGSVLIKNSLGNFSLFLLVAVLFEPLILLVSVNLLLRFTAAITQPFGDSKIAVFLEETAENLNYCTAGLLFTAFLYFIVILLLVCSSEMFL
ncbi:MAG: stage III sporulation protein AE [Clostridia bacterium]|nr:stage III sporulation protein AE [Clostridia bacterium]